MSRLRNMALAMAMGARLANRVRKGRVQMHTTRNMLLAMGLGAGAMYLLDPQQGRRRRALLRDKMVAMRNDFQHTVQGKSRYMRDKATGMMYEAQEKVQDVSQASSPAGRQPVAGAG